MKKSLFLLLPIVIFLFFTCFECESNVEPLEQLEPELVWSYKLPELATFNDDLMPVIDDGFTYVAAKGTIKKVELQNGVVFWETSLGIEGNGAAHSHKLLHYERLLFLNHKSWVKAFNKDNGELIWETILENFNSIDLSIMSQNKSSLLLGGQNECVKLNKFTGEIELRLEIKELMVGGNSQSARDPIISDVDDYIYVPTGYNSAEGLKGNILCYNSISGQFLWGFKGNVPDSNPSSCAIKDSFVVFADGRKITALNRFTGTKIWDIEVKNDAFEASIIIDKETIYIGSHAESFMYAFELINGKLKWKSENTPSSIITIPTVVDNKIYFSNWAYIYVLNTTDGSTLWKSLPPEYEEDNSYRYISPVAVGEGYIVCIGNKKVYCLTDPWHSL